MPTGKRASMREGPLAALFRKTAEDSSAQSAEPESQAPQAPETSPVRETPPAPEAQAPPPAPPQTERRSLPHPSFEDPAPDTEPEDRYVPSPQERLRHAFSSDIPDNVLEPPARAGTHPRCVRPPRARVIFGRPGCRWPGDPGRRRRRRRRQRGQPDGRGGDRGDRVPGHQHRPAVAAAVGRPRDPAHRRLADARARVGVQSRPRPPGRA